MQLDTPELQLLLIATRGAAYAARTEQEQPDGRFAAALLRSRADALERIASRLEAELARAARQTGTAPSN